MWPIGSVTQFTNPTGKSRGLRLDLVENGWKFSNSTVPDPMAAKFTTMTDILRAEMAWLADPDDKRPTLEMWHVAERGFGCRLSRPSARTGRQLRIWLYRRPKEEGGDQKERIGTFEERTLDEAQDYVRTQKVDVSLRKSGIAIKKNLTVAEGLEKYLENKSGNLRDPTIKQYRKVWAYLDEQDSRAPKSKKDQKPFSQRTFLHQLDGQWWLDEYTRVARRHGRSSARSFYRVAHAVYAYWVRRLRLQQNPLLQVAEDKKDEVRQPPPNKTIIPAKSMAAFWNWLETKALPATRDLTKVELLSGIRSAVAGQLRWSQVNAEVRTYIIPAEERGNKNKTLVEIPIGDELWLQVFEPRLKQRSSAHDWVIPSAKRSGQPAKSTRGAMEGLLASTGIKASPHICRRTFGSMAQMATGDSLMVARLLTHSVHGKDRDSNAPLVTAGYIHYEEDVMRQALNKTAALIMKHANATPLAKAA